MARAVRENLVEQRFAMSPSEMFVLASRPIDIGGESIAQTAEEAALAVGSVAGEANNLRGLANDLDAMTSRFKV